MKIAELVAAIILAVLSIYMMWKSGQPAWEGDPRFLNIWFDEGEGPGSGFWPFWLSVVILLCCVWIIVNWVRRTSPMSRSDEPYLDSYGMMTLLKVGGGVLMFIFLVSGFSFLDLNFPGLKVDPVSGYPIAEFAMIWKLPIGAVLEGSGMYFSMFLFLIYYIRFLGRHSLATTLAVATSVPVALFFFFDVAMRIVLPKGYLEPLFIPLYDKFL